MSRKRRKIETLLLQTNRKWYMTYRVVAISMTLSDLDATDVLMYMWLQETGRHYVWRQWLLVTDLSASSPTARHHAIASCIHCAVTDPSISLIESVVWAARHFCGHRASTIANLRLFSSLFVAGRTGVHGDFHEMSLPVHEQWRIQGVSGVTIPGDD